jgi:NADH-quinone oxidoreductase subunit E/NADP-reducing hydrogenase subunit HndA
MDKIIIKMKKEVREKIIEICNRFNNNPGELINVLHATQDYLGYLPAEAQELIAECLHIPTAKVYGVVSFYAFFTMTPKGKYPISVCLGTACYVRGAEKILDAFKKELNLEVGQTTPDGLFSLTCLRCVGACGLAPVAMVGDKVYGRLAPADVKNIVKEYKDLEAANA